MILGGNISPFQFSSLYNPVDSRVRERVRKMLLMGVTQRSEMRRHINIFVEENFPSVSKMDTSFYPSDQSLSSIMYRAMILHRHSHLDQEKVLTLVSKYFIKITGPRQSKTYILYNNSATLILIFQVEGWKEKREQDFFYFRPATQVTEADDDSQYEIMYSTEEEDDILYSCPQSEHSEPTSLLFIHQSNEQLHILKWYYIICTRKIMWPNKSELFKYDRCLNNADMSAFVGTQGLF